MTFYIVDRNILSKTSEAQINFPKSMYIFQLKRILQFIKVNNISRTSANYPTVNFQFEED